MKRLNTTVAGIIAEILFAVGLIVMGFLAAVLIIGV